MESLHHEYYSKLGPLFGNKRLMDCITGTPVITNKLYVRCAVDVKISKMSISITRYSIDDNSKDKTFTPSSRVSLEKLLEYQGIDV